MAKKTKDLENEPQKTEKKKNITKKTTSVKKATVKKEATKKTSTAKKSNTSKKSTSTKKATTTKKSTASKTPTKKTSAKKATTTRSKSKAEKTIPQEFQTEYYDLPYGYNKTVVKVLAQTPRTLFVYWEISEDDRNRFKQTYGERFFEETKPILIVYNNTLHYSFEVDINDFANSWYITINDSKCNYTVELGRKPIPFISRVFEPSQSYIPYYVYVTSSNKMDAPNNHVLYDFYKEHKSVKFRNIKTGEIIYKDISQFKFITNLGIMTINELYKKLYPDEDFEYENFIGNPSSGITSSGSRTSRFK